MWIRHVLVPGLTDDPEGLKRTRGIYRQLKDRKACSGVLPYHTLRQFKLGAGDRISTGGVRTPTEEEVKTLRNYWAL